MVYEPRTYRDQILAEGLVSFVVTVKETDLHVSADKDLKKKTVEVVRHYREEIERHHKINPRFSESYVPLEVPASAPAVIQEMAKAASMTGVGPMAAVAGAIAGAVGRELLNWSDEIIVENGGDIFMKTNRPRHVLIYAGDSPLSNMIALEIRPEETPIGICTSAGTVGHSLSFGQADAVVVISPNTCLADAAATAIGNRVHRIEDIKSSLAYGQAINELKGIVIIKEDQMGVWGDIRLTPP